jgi:cytochrome c-type biogenesis protein CcmH
MILLALFIVVFPLRAQRKVDVLARDDAALSLYGQHLSDLQSDIDSGIIDKEQASIAKIELEHRLLHEMEGTEGEQEVKDTDHSRDWMTSTFLIILLPVFALALYYKLGQPQLTNQINTFQVNTANENTEQLPSIEELVVGLEQHQEETPGDEKGWWMLTRTYMALNRLEDARMSAEILYELSGDQADVLLLYANVLLLINEGNFTDKITSLVQQALSLDPDNINGLWLAGLGAENQSDYQAAMDYFHKLSPLIATDKAAVQQLNQVLEKLQGSLEADTLVGESIRPGGGVDVKANEGIVVNVSLAPELVDQADPEDILFVFARAQDGMPMPVAVNRLSVADLPVSVVLNDAQAMMPSRLLSSFKEVQVMARISKSGNAIENSGDLKSDEKIVRVGNEETVVLKIDQLVP